MLKLVNRTKLQVISVSCVHCDSNVLEESGAHAAAHNIIQNAESI